MNSLSAIPWGTLLGETVAFFKKFNPRLGSFFLVFFLLSILGQSEVLDMSDLTPLHLWTSVTLFLVLFTASYFVFVMFVLWVRGERNGAQKLSFSEASKTTAALMLPLTILSIRGACLFLFGLILLIIPGFYFSFKYELASFCLILEGWKNEAPPVRRAEQLISVYRFSLLLLGILMLLEWTVPWFLEAFLKYGGVPMTLFMKAGIAAVDAALSIFIDVYIILTVLHLINQSRQAQQVRIAE